MFNRRSFGMLVFACIVSLGVLTQAEAAKGPGRGGRNKAGKVEGTLVSVIVGSVTIQTRAGVTITLQVPSTAKIERNGVHVSLLALQIGDRAQALYDPATLIASKVESRS